jgi:tol-pal system protein YbgF
MSQCGRRVSLGLLVALALAGCGPSGGRLQSTEATTARLQDDVDTLQRRQTQLQSTVDSLSVLVDEQTALLRNQRAERDVTVQDLQTQVAALQTDLDATKLALATLQDQLRYGRVGPDSSVAVSDAAGADPRDLYDAAYQDLTRGNHGLAIMGFEEILQLYPQSQLADNAQYWLGETYYVQKDYEKALEAFRKVPLNYPAGDKVPAALLKAGYCLVELGETEAAREALQDLIDRFPGSEEARLADDKLGRF